MIDTDLATEAYLDGFALVFDIEQVTRATTSGFDGTWQLPVIWQVDVGRARKGSHVHAPLPAPAACGGGPLRPRLAYRLGS